jgi:hypothetical protein
MTAPRTALKKDVSENVLGIGTSSEPKAPRPKCSTCGGSRFVPCRHCSPCGCVVCAETGRVPCPTCRKEGGRA